jgi:predicted transcriptional regulator
MKTAVSLPNDVFDDAERLARRLHKSRSELYREAIAEYVARHEPERVTEALDRVAAETDPAADSLFRAAAARRTLERTDW